MKSRRWTLVALLVAIGLVVVGAIACGPNTPEPNHQHEHDTDAPSPGDIQALAPIDLSSGEALQVVATTNIVGDVVSQIGGDRIELTTLMSIGVDPHSYVPTPSGTAAIHDAHVVFANGAGLEADLDEILNTAGGEAIQIHVSHGLEHRALQEDDEADTGDHDHGNINIDPHVWFDVQNVIHWSETIQDTLSALDPANAEDYQENASAFISQLEELDAWVVDQVAQIPESNRKLVTSHPVFGYFADRYGLEQVGAVYPISPSSEPSARDIAALEDAIIEFEVPAVFAESTVSPKLAEQVAEDTGIKLVPLYTGSLGEPGSGAETYILLIRYDVNAIVESLK